MSSHRRRQSSPPRPQITISRKEDTSRPEKRWYQHLTLDLVVYVLSRSIFHPAIVYIFYLCIAALHRHRTPVAHYTLYWASILLVIAGLRWLNWRIVHGKPRAMDWSSEVVVVTGGGSGLGRVIAEMYALRGVSTAILDLKAADAEALDLMDGGNGSLSWFQCDVGDRDGVDVVMEVIKQQIGRPTILFNNAASPIVGKGLYSNSQAIGALPVDDAVRSIGVNLLAHFYTLTSTLRNFSFISQQDSASGLTVVTISSILGHLSPAKLSDYVASKAGASSLHHSLTHELRLNPHLASRVKTLLVEIGQIDTGLFAKVKTPWYSAFFAPIMEAKDVARVVVGIVDRGEGGVIRMPFYATLVPWYAVFPESAQMLLRWASGIDTALDDR